ncbi:UNVERIFIED_CONTAM: hypothetical protein RMT77_014627 [Armadillidium vulgare]
MLIWFYCFIFSQAAGEVMKHNWGYIHVREGAEMFFLGYFTKNYQNRPLILWLQGGPGASSTGIGNILEVGPTDLQGKTRKYSWTNLTSVIFVDSPVGTGYSYVWDKKILPTTDVAAAKDLLTFLISLFMQKLTDLGQAPFYIFGESYGAKIGSELALLLLKAIKEKKIICNFKGIAFGDPWLSPSDSVENYARFLYANSLIDTEGVEPILSVAGSIWMKIANGQTKEAANIFFNKMEPTVTNETNGVNFYNILKNPQEEFGVPMSNEIFPVSMEATKHRPSHFSSVKNVLTSDEMKELSKLMNGPMKKMLRLPNNITWSSQSSLVFRALEDDFMRPATVTVEKLLNETTLDIMIYNGQLDLIVPSMGSENWVRELKWPGMSSWAKTKRIPLLSDNNVTSGYYKKFKNFSFFWILKAGHMVPLDAPSTAYKMLCTYLSEKC